MRKLTTVISAVLTIFGIVAATDISADAAGAMAIGRCNRVGYAYDNPTPAGAAIRALAECSSNGDGSCKVVVTLRRSCGAFAVAGQGGCGARGWAYAGSRRAAENIALNNCRQLRRPELSHSGLGLRRRTLSLRVAVGRQGRNQSRFKTRIVDRRRDSALS